MGKLDIPEKYPHRNQNVDNCVHGNFFCGILCLLFPTHPVALVM